MRLTHDDVFVTFPSEFSGDILTMFVHCSSVRQLPLKKKKKHAHFSFLNAYQILVIFSDLNDFCTQRANFKMCC